MDRNIGRWFAAPLGIVLLGLLLAGPAISTLRAHGIGKPQVLNQPAGPYLISAWTDPDPLRADESHVVIAVADPATNELIVGGVEVSVVMTSLDDPARRVAVVAGTDNVNQLLYAAEFNDQVGEGRWRVGITVAGDRGVSDEIEFEVAIAPARGFNWLWAGIGGMAAIIIIWLAGSMRGDKPRRDKPHRPDDRLSRT